MGPDRAVEQVAELCSSGVKLTSGPLNDTYAVVHEGTRLFVRHRVVRDPAYGQTFAAERYIGDTVRAIGIRVPALRGVVTDRNGYETYALFDYIDGTRPDYTAPSTLTEIAEILARLHQIHGTELGNIGEPLSHASVAPFLADLIVTELARQPHNDLAALAENAHAWIRILFDSEPIRLVHGDVHGGNWLRDRDGHLWLIDWEACRWRVAASDFNQLRHHWLDADQERQLLDAYLQRTDATHDRAETLELQISAMRLLWHLRTYNFFTLVRHENPMRHESHLRAVEDLARVLTVTA